MEIFTYQTIAALVQAEFKDKGSSFTAYAYPVRTESEVKEYVDKLKQEHHKARHHCYAYRISVDGNRFRANDDGEPSSTGGKPIMGQINSNELTDILVCVVRYYGGVNLGTSGLIEAYRAAAAAAIEDAEKIECFQKEELKFHFTYPMLNGVMRVVKEMNATIVSQEFDNDCDITLSIRSSLAEQLKTKLEKLAFE